MNRAKKPIALVVGSALSITRGSPSLGVPDVEGMIGRVRARLAQAALPSSAPFVELLEASAEGSDAEELAKRQLAAARLLKQAMPQEFDTLSKDPGLGRIFQALRIRRMGRGGSAVVGM